MTRRSDIASLDGLRAAAILLVFLAHVPIAYSVPGGFGVTLFFFLSGFLITTLMLREQARTGQIALGAFFQRRLVRLVPPILATLAAALAVLAVGLAPGDGDLWAVPAQVLFYFNYYLVSIHGGTAVEGLGVLWSLSVEMHFYLLWPFVFLALMRGRRAVQGLLVLLAAVLIWRTIRIYGFGAHEWVVMLSSDTRLDSLLWGCLLALLMRPGGALDGLQVRTWQAGGLLAAAGAVLLLADFGMPNGQMRASLQYSLEGLALVPVFFLAVRYPQFWVFRPLNWGFVRKVGHWSYAIYLGHYVIIETLAAQGTALGLEIGQSGWVTLAFVVVAGAVTLVWGWAVHVLVERPFQPLRARLHTPTGQEARAPG